MTAYLAPALAGLVLVLTVALLAAIAAWRQVDRTNASLSRRCNHQAGRIRSHRSEANLLAEACDRLTRRNEEQRDELDALTRPGAPEMTAQMFADLAALPTTHEREYPR